MSKFIKKLALAAVFMTTVAGISMKAQGVAIKTDLLYDATLTANLGVEFGLAPKWSFDLSGNFKSWNATSRVWKHWMLQPEARYWFCDRFARHFIGVHGIAGQFNWGHFKNPWDFLGTPFTKLKDNRAQGWGVGAGVAYGYAWVLNRHWNIEAELGLGFIHTWYDVYECRDCGKLIARDLQHTYYGPTKLAINLVYVF